MRSSGEDTSSANFAVRLERFFSEWNAATEPTVSRHADAEWTEFFDDWHKHVPAVSEATAVTTASPDPARFAEFMGAFPVAFEEYRRSGSMLNVWRTARLGIDEVRNCKVLATFLDHTEDHGQGADILCSLLSIVELPGLAARAARRRYQTRTEVWPLGDADCRVDIEIEGDDFLIFIEVKIAANEGDDQLQRYVDLARAKAGCSDWTVIYLTSDGRRPANSVISDVYKIKSAS